MNSHAKISHAHAKNPVVHVRVRWIMERHQDKPACIKSGSLHNVDFRHCREEEETVKRGPVHSER